MFSFLHNSCQNPFNYTVFVSWLFYFDSLWCIFIGESDGFAYIQYQWIWLYSLPLLLFPYLLSFPPFFPFLLITLCFNLIDIHTWFSVYIITCLPPYERNIQYLSFITSFILFNIFFSFLYNYYCDMS